MDNSHSESKKISPPVERLRDAVWGEPEDDLSHAECRAALVKFAQAEAAGEPVAKLYPRVKHHLDHCAECGEEYALLLDLELAEARGEIQFTPSVEPTSLPLLEQLARELARRVAESLAPSALREIKVIADTFFARVQQLGAFELRANAAQALGLGRRDANPALNLLAASYIATQNLMRDLTRAQFDEWARQKTLPQELEARANAAARAIGIEREFAARFARAYAKQIAQEPDALRALLTDV
ncbi:MAG: hypothetical protein BroJett039_14130 [Chloroflexota bacterium]|nr:MAG: hypothetical protein BroJett039_14130 [Chloroflexota bacterium]